MTDKLFNQDYLYSLCQNYNLRPSKKYGQNYLINPESIEQMMEAAAVGPNDTVVEVGPGFGVLTLALAQHAQKVYAFEIEKKLQDYWMQHAPKNVEIIWGNVLQNTNYKIQTTKYKVVANLPYQITSHVIRQFLESDNPPELMVLMVQKEVGERICAAQGEMSLLSVAVQYYAEPSIVAYVPRTDFWPSPQVDSVVIKFKIKDLRLKIKDDQRDEFFKIVKAGFANRRKLLKRNLEAAKLADAATLRSVFEQLKLGPNTRAQELSVEQWQQLAVGIYPQLH